LIFLAVAEVLACGDTTCSARECGHAFGEAFSLTVGQRANGGEMLLGARHDQRT
jgi:hypothetical protein